MKVKFCLCLCLIFTIILSSLNLSFATDKISGSTIRLESYSGGIIVVSGTGKKQVVSSKMRIFSGYTIVTATNATAYLSLDGTKSVRLNQNTKVIIKKRNNANEIQVLGGSIFFNVTEKLKDNESLNVTTSTLAMGIRGTSGMLKVDKNGSKGQIYTGRIIAKNRFGDEKAVEAGEEVDEIDWEDKSNGFKNLKISKINRDGSNIPSFVLNEFNNNEEAMARLKEDNIFEVEKFPEAEVKNREREENELKEAQKLIDEIREEANKQKEENKPEMSKQTIGVSSTKEIKNEYDELNSQKLNNSEGKVYIFEFDPETGAADLKQAVDSSGDVEIKNDGSNVNIYENDKNKESIDVDGNVVYKVVL